MIKNYIKKLIIENLNEDRNIKMVKIIIPNENILKRIKTTPTLSRLSRLDLKVGENIENVNHTQYSDMMRLYPLLGVNVEVIG